MVVVRAAELMSVLGIATHFFPPIVKLNDPGGRGPWGRVGLVDMAKMVVVYQVKANPVAIFEGALWLER